MLKPGCSGHGQLRLLHRCRGKAQKELSCAWGPVAIEIKSIPMRAMTLSLTKFRVHDEGILTARCQGSNN